MAVRKTKAGTFECDFRDQFGKKRLKTFPTQKEAKAFEKEVLAQVARGEYVPPSSRTVSEVAWEWYQGKAGQAYRRPTLVAWKTHVENVVPSLGNIRVRDLDVARVEQAAVEWANRTSPVTSNKALTTFTAILDMAERRGEIKRNPAEKAERLNIPTEDETTEVEPDQVYGKPELAKLIQASDGASRVLIMVLAFTGMRIGRNPGAPLGPGRFQRGKDSRPMDAGGFGKPRGAALPATQDSIEQAEHPYSARASARTQSMETSLSDQ